MEIKLKVFTGNPNFNGRRYGVPFIKGVGEATEKQARVLVKNWGYKCPELDAPKPSNEKNQTKDEGENKNPSLSDLAKKNETPKK